MIVKANKWSDLRQYGKIIIAEDGKRELQLPIGIRTSDPSPAVSIRDYVSTRQVLPRGFTEIHAE